MQELNESELIDEVSKLLQTYMDARSFQESRENRSLSFRKRQGSESSVGFLSTVGMTSLDFLRRINKKGINTRDPVMLQGSLSKNK